MFPYTTPENLLLVALIKSKQAKHSYGLLSLHITADKWNNAVLLQITEPLFGCIHFTS